MSGNSSSDSIQAWAIIATIAAIFFAIGWYNSDPIQSNVSNSVSSETQLEDYKDKINEYKDSLNEANETIKESNDCVDGAFGLLDEDNYEEALYELDECRYDSVSEPSDL